MRASVLLINLPVSTNSKEDRNRCLFTYVPINTAVKVAVAEGNALWDKGHAAYNTGRIEAAVVFLKNAEPKVDAAAAALQLHLPGTDQDRAAEFYKRGSVDVRFRAS